MGLVSEKGKFYICQVSDSFVRMGGGSLTEKNPSRWVLRMKETEDKKKTMENCQSLFNH